MTVSSWVLWRRENGLEIGLGLNGNREEKEGRKRKAEERDVEGVLEVRGKRLTDGDLRGGRREKGNKF